MLVSGVSSSWRNAFPMSSFWPLFAKLVCLEVRIPEAEGRVFVDAAEDTFRRDGVVSAGEASRQQDEPVAAEDRIELVERERAGTAGADEEEVAVREPGLDGRHVQGLQELGLEQLADPGDLVTLQNRVGIG